MREEAPGGEEPSWFARWEEELPTPEELMPLSQTLITPDLALAFDIPTPHNTTTNNNHHPTNSNSAPPPPSSLLLHHHHHHLPPPSDFDSADLGSSGGGASGTNGGDEPARTLKRPRLVWTPQLHKRFVDAVAHLGIKNAVPKTIMQLMSVDGLTRENVASHLQKYRLYLKRMQGLSSAGSSGSAGPISAADDQLFSTGPIPHHFLSRAGAGAGHGVGPEPYVPFVPMAALQQHHQQMAAAAAAAAAAQQQFYHQRQLGHFGSAAAGNGGGGGGGGGGFDHGFLSRTPPQAGLHRMGPGGLHSIVQPMAQGPNTAASYVDDLEERSGTGGRKVLTLFPTGED